MGVFGSLRSRTGQALLEYALLIALVAACLVAILGLTRNAARNAYARTSSRMAPVAPAGFGSGGRTSAGGTWGPDRHSDDSEPPADSAAQASDGQAGSTGSDPAR